MISDQKARQNIMTDLTSSFAVDAGAGTGKTTLLIDRLAALILEKETPLTRIAAITFTDKAAGELVERLRHRLEREFDSEKMAGLPPTDRKNQEKLLRQALKDLEQAMVSTIHAFCSSLLREYPIEIGVDPQFAVLDQVQTDALETQAWENWLKKSLAQRVDSLMPFFHLGGNFEHVEKLKDHLLKNRSLIEKPDVPALPDPNGTLIDLKRLWTQLGELFKPISQEDGLVVKLRELEKEWHEVLALSGEKQVFALAGLDIPKVTRAGNQKNWNKENLETARNLVMSFQETQEIFAAQVKDSAVQGVAAWLWDYLDEYAKVKTQQGFLDFDDLLSKTRDLLKTRVEVREELKKRYDHLFVDEFQDTDPLQVEIVFFLSESKKKKAKTWQEVQLEPGKLFLVGDPQQSIYRFRRADVEIYGEAKARLEACGGKVEKLTENFRTLSPIVEWVNEGFDKLFADGPFPYNSQKAHRIFEKKPGTLTPLIGLEIPEVPEDQQRTAVFRKIEAETVADFIQQLIQEKTLIVDRQSPKGEIRYKEVEAGDIAILFRELSNTEAVYEDALRQRNIQFQIVGGKKFYNRPEVVALETLLTCLESPADEVGLTALLRSPLFGFTDEELFHYRESGGVFHFLRAASGKMGEAFRLLRVWYFATRKLGPAETLLYLYDQTNLLAVAACQPHGEQRVANLMKVVDQCRDLEVSQNFTYRAFVKWLSRQREEDAMEGEAPGPEETGNQVTLMTLHKAKGLEFPIVILSGAAPEKGRAPEFIVNRHQNKAQFKAGAQELKLATALFEKAKAEEEDQERAETLRLLYVGCTRGRESLVLPLFTQEKVGGFLKPLTTLFDEKSLEKRKVTVRKEVRQAGALAVDLPEKDRQNSKVQELKARLRKLIDDKKALVEKRKGKVRLASVTSLVHSDDDKSLREGYRLEGEVLEALREEAVDGKAFGILTHQLLEKGWNWDKDTLAKAALFWAPEMGLTAEKAQESAQLALKALENDLLKRAKKSQQVFRELSLTGQTSNGKYLNAVIDLAFIEDDQWIIVDYKTDKDPNRGVEVYRQQLSYYGQLLETFTGKKVKGTYLYFLRHDRVE